MNGAGGMGGFGGYGGGGSPGAPGGPGGPFGGGPARGPFGARGNLAAVPAPSRIGFDPPTPPELIGIIRRWHPGKKWRRDGAASTPILLPWLAMELSHFEDGFAHVIHPIDDLGNTTDDEDLAHEVWERCKGCVRSKDDGLSHHFELKCYFGDDEGRQTFETWSSGPLMLPRDRADWGGTSTSMQARMMGGMGGRAGFGGHSHPHHASQEIDAMNLAHNLVRETMNIVVGENRDLRASRDRYQDRELKVMELIQDLMDDKRKHEIEIFESNIKMGALKMIAGRMAKLGPVVGLRLSEWANGKMNGAKKRSAREELAFDTMKTIARGLQKNGADSLEKLTQAFKMFGIDLDQDEQLRDDMIKLMMEFEIDEQTKKIEASAREDVSIEPPAKAAAPADETTLEPPEEG